MQPAHHPHLDPNDPALDLGSKALGMIVPGLIVAAIGGAVAFYFGFRVPYAPTLFYHAYLVAFVFFLMITLGALFFVILHHLARAGWSVTLRRVAEALSGNVWLMILLFLPLVFSLDQIYSWANAPATVAAADKPAKNDKTETKGTDAKGTENKGSAAAVRKLFDAPQAAASASAANDNSSDEKMAEKTGDKPAARRAKKSGEKTAAAKSAEGGEEDAHGATIGHHYWLTRNGFIGRFVICFLVWGLLAWYYRGESILQDTTGSVALTRKMERLAAPGMILFGITLTTASFDLIMSLNPRWFSTMIGVYLFADTVLSGLVAVSLLALALQSAGLLRGAVTEEHYHDLGKLTFAFVFFWGYIAFSQYMLIWYSNIPEETQFYMPRQIGGWAAVSLTLIIVHFVLPFLGLMSRHAKRALPVFAFWLIWLLVAQAFDLFWLIMPNVFVRQLPVNKPLPDVFKTLLESQQSVYQLARDHQTFLDFVNAPLTAPAIATVIGLLMFMGGLYVASTVWHLSAARLVAVKDPRLEESLSFHNV